MLWETSSLNLGVNSLQVSYKALGGNPHEVELSGGKTEFCSEQACPEVGFQWEKTYQEGKLRLFMEIAPFQKVKNHVENSTKANVHEKVRQSR